jgi:tRNA modification GTPase
VNDTIVARITGAGRAAVAVLRISGPDTQSFVQGLAGSMPAPRLATLRTLRGAAGETIDRALILWMPAPDSFTGEDCAEFHVHGGPAVIEAVTAALTGAGARPAQPGEFSRRVFANGKLDLLQAEAVADLVDAETDAQRRQALGQLGGEASRRYEGWRARLIRALALIEAEIDFPDEDLPGAVAQEARPSLASLADELRESLSDARRGQQVRDGYRIALIGAPNAGKSSLFNALLQREAAIVSPRPGTTRDIVEAQLRIGGFSVTLADTAGLRATDDDVEAEGVRRAEAWSGGAALRLLVIDPTAEAEFARAEEARARGDIIVLSKSDLLAAYTPEALAWAGSGGEETLRATASEAGGVDELVAAIERRVQADLGAAEQPLVTRARHEFALRSALGFLEAAMAALVTAPERAAEDVRAAVNALESIVGRVDREAVLDQLFASFCIGK